MRLTTSLAAGHVTSCLSHDLQTVLQPMFLELMSIRRNE